MTSIDTFFVLAAVVVLLGIVVWRRDIKTGRIPRPKPRGPSMSVRERFADRVAPKASSIKAPRSDAKAAAQRKHAGLPPKDERAAAAAERRDDAGES